MQTLLPERGLKGISQTAVCDVDWYGFPFEVRTSAESGSWDDPHLPVHWLVVHLEGSVAVQIGTKQRKNEYRHAPGSFSSWLPGRHWDTCRFQGVSNMVSVFCDWRLLRNSRLLEASELPLLEDILVGRSDSIVTSLVLSMVREQQDGCLSGRLYAETLSLALAARLAGIAREVRLYEGEGLGRKRAALVQDFVEEYLAEDISVADLAKLVNLSPSRFATLFRVSFSLPVHRYVTNRRVERAMSLLRIGNFRNADIAVACGFASESHFNDVFRRVTGSTPGNFRRLGTHSHRI